MFDITSYVREKIFRRPKIITNLAWEELSEKQTTKLWYFLLYCMFWAIIMSAQWSLSIIKWIPSIPQNVPYCIENIVSVFDVKNNINENNSYYYWWNFIYDNNTCSNLISTNPSFDFTSDYNKLLDPFKKISDYRNKIQTAESTKSSLEYTQNNTKQDYNTSLTEKIANENSGIYNKNQIQNDIKNNNSEISALENQITDYKAKISEINSQYKTDVENLITKINKTNEDYYTAYLIYRIYVAILSFLFSIVIFLVLYKIYVKQKIKNSPNTIIFSVATFAYWLILLQVASLFIWDIIPHKLLKLIEELFTLFTPLVYIVQFIWPVLIIAIFWFLVYRIQKRLYSPENILKRFITDKKCPKCWNWVDFTKPFCPLCSNEIQIHCPSCKELTLKWMPFCSNCWTKIIEK